MRDSATRVGYHVGRIIAIALPTSQYRKDRGSGFLQFAGDDQSVASSLKHFLSQIAYSISHG